MRAVCCVVLALLASCRPPAAPFRATPDPAAESLFHRDPRWLGGDAAYSIDLGHNRSLWLFGDSILATSPANTRAASTMVHNTLALQAGRDPATAAVSFFWRTTPEGAPASFFPDEGSQYLWPHHGTRLGETGPLLLFLTTVRSTPGKDLGFATTGVRAVLVDRPDDDPLRWSPRALAFTPPPFDALLGAAVVREGGFVFALAIRNAGVHEGYLARVREADLLAGRLDLAWWDGARGWVPQAALAGKPAVVLDDAGAECSIHRDPQTGRFVHVASRGFGATTIAVRFAEALTGPWTPPVDVYTPPESRAARPLVYAGKAHPEIRLRGGGLAVTYATNSFDFWTLFKPEGAALYWPRFVAVEIGR